MKRIIQVSPSIVRADCETELTLRSNCGFIRFYDDVTYKIQFVPVEEYDKE